MNISFLTTDEPLFLPKFFERLLPALSLRHPLRVYSVPPLYKSQTSAQADTLQASASRPRFSSPRASFAPSSPDSR
jgi:hypothetical protein